MKRLLQSRIPVFASHLSHPCRPVLRSTCAEPRSNLGEMHCLKCWEVISDKTAVYTKSCKHVFCKRCSSTAFKKELSCPLCDTVLPKDGIGAVTLLPDANEIGKAGSKTFGFEPEQMCEVLKLGLDFWVKQKENESLLHARELKGVQKRMAELEEQNARLSRALNEERLRKTSLQNEKDGLQKTISDLEARYAQKARSMRKLSELYNELRQVHRRLEADLRGVREPNDFEAEPFPGSEFEINTHGRSGNAGIRDGPGSHNEREYGSRRGNREGAFIRGQDRAPENYDETPLHEVKSKANTTPQELERRQMLFNLAPNLASNPRQRMRASSRNVIPQGIRRRRYSPEPAPDISAADNGGHDDHHFSEGRR